MSSEMSTTNAASVLKALLMCKVEPREYRPLIEGYVMALGGKFELTDNYLTYPDGRYYRNYYVEITFEFEKFRYKARYGQQVLYSTADCATVMAEIQAQYRETMGESADLFAEVYIKRERANYEPTNWNT